MATDRRSLLRAGLAVTALGAAGGLAIPLVNAVRQNPAMGEATGEAISASSIDGRLRRDAKSLNSAADDFGHIIHRQPSGVLEPGSARDVAMGIRRAAETGKKVAAQGEGHSVYGRAQVDGGLVIDMSTLKTVHSVESDRVVVDAGAKWSEVLAVTLPKGLTPPVLADYLELSVGGTLVVGGVGAATGRSGTQSDNILELDVVTGNGEEMTCSPTHNAELFNAVRAGLGQCAIITRATLPLIPAPEQVRRYLLTYPDLRTLLTDQRRTFADGRFDWVQGLIPPNPAGGWTFQLDASVQFSSGAVPDDATVLAGLSDDRSGAQIGNSTYLASLQRLAPLEQLLRSTGAWFHPHPWLTTFVGDSAIENLTTSVLNELTPADLGTVGRVAVSPVRRRPITSPLLRTPDEDVFFTFNLLRFPHNDAALAERLVAANRSIYERVLGARGTLYPVSAFPMSRTDWERHFGAAFGKFRAAKERFDPRNTLTPGYEVF